MTPTTLVAMSLFALTSIGCAFTWSYHRRRESGDPNLLSAALNLAVLTGLVAISFGLQGVPLPNSVRSIVGLLLVAGALVAVFRAISGYLRWARPRDRRALQQVQARRKFRNEGPDIERLP